MSDLAGNPYASIVELSKAYRNKSSHQVKLPKHNWRVSMP